jgi:serine protease AprX
VAKLSNRRKKDRSAGDSTELPRVARKLDQQHVQENEAGEENLGDRPKKQAGKFEDPASRASETTLPSQVRAAAERQIFGASGEGIVWAIIDSGIDARHPHFQLHQNVSSDVPSLHRDFTSYSDASSSELEALVDANGHGTHTAGVIAGELTSSDSLSLRAELTWYNEMGEKTTSTAKFPNISGVAPRCKLVSLKVLDDHGKGTTSDVLAALAHIQEINGYGRRLRIHGVCLALAYSYEAKRFACGQSPLCIEVNRLVQSGVVVVAAAGNSGFGIHKATTSNIEAPIAMSISDPGNAELAITVGATNGVDPHNFGVLYFSSKGPTADGRHKPDLVAPGEAFLSSIPASSKVAGQAPEDSTRSAYYGESTGTATAAAYVSGVIAALLSVRRDLIGHPARVKQLLLATAEDLKRDRYIQGHGFVNLMRALTDGTATGQIGVAVQSAEDQQPPAASAQGPLRVFPPTPIETSAEIPAMSDPSTSNKRFSVAVSFPGEKRDYVKDVVAELRQLKMPRKEIFYDKFYPEELAVPDLDTVLQQIYRNDSELIVIFISAEYEKKDWCGLEWRAIRDIIKARRGQDIMPLRFDDTDVPGLFSIDGYLDLRDRDPDNVAALILKRLQSNRNRAAKR